MLPEDDAGTKVLPDYQGRAIRLTRERRAHILEHPEMAGEFERIAETLWLPELVVVTLADESVHVYHRFYPTTPVTGKYLQVAVKLLERDAFVLTAFYSSRQKRGKETWWA